MGRTLYRMRCMAVFVWTMPVPIHARKRASQDRAPRLVDAGLFAEPVGEDGREREDDVHDLRKRLVALGGVEARDLASDVRSPGVVHDVRTAWTKPLVAPT